MDRTCTVCGHPQPVAEFTYTTNGKEYYRKRCKECTRKDALRRYHARREQAAIVHKRWKRETREEVVQHILDYFAEHPCVDCNEQDPLTLTFDHQRDKRNSVGNMLNRSYSWKAILAEIKKCEVRCANCHSKKTAREQGWLMYRMLCEQSTLH